jgi:hypothetical protein
MIIKAFDIITIFASLAAARAVYSVVVPSTSAARHGGYDVEPIRRSFEARRTLVARILLEERERAAQNKANLGGAA